MSGNPPGSPWRSTPRASRKRRALEITLSDEARAKLDRVAKARGETRSRCVERLIIASR